MPGIGVHLLALDETLRHLDKTQAGRTLADAMRAHRPDTYLGAIGPDLLAFYGKEGEWVGRVADIIGFLTKSFDPVFALSGKMANTPLNQLGQLVDDARRAYHALVKTLCTQILATNGPLAQLLVGDLIRNPAIQTPGYPEKDWKWFDLLHWQLTRAITRQTVFDSQKLQAYRNGYVVHLAADLTGHPYTNHVVGGPSRSHAMRHHFAENAMDTWTWYQVHEEEIALARLHKKIEGVSSSTLQALSKALSNAYEARKSGSAPLPQAPTYEDVSAAYDVLKKALSLVSELTFFPKPAFPQMWQDLPEAFQQIPQLLNDHRVPRPGWDWTLTDWLVAMINFVQVLLDAQVMLFNLLQKIATDAAVYPLRLAIWLLESCLWLLQRVLYELLVLIGVAFPLHEDLGNSLFAQFLKTGRSLDINYPHVPTVVTSPARDLKLKFSDKNVEYTVIIGLPETQRSTFFWYPDTRHEQASDEPDNHLILASPYFDRECSYFLKDAKLDGVVYYNYADALTPAATHQLNRKYLEPQKALPFGNAANLGASLILGELPLREWNIDADRAYGAKYWRHSGDLNSPDGFEEGKYRENPSMKSLLAEDL